MKPPPEPFTNDVIRCPSCQHGIDPHGLDPGGLCGVGDEHRNPCPCMWQPNDIAAEVLRAELARYRPVGSPFIHEAQDGQMIASGPYGSDWAKALVGSVEEVVELFVRNPSADTQDPE